MVTPTFLRIYLKRGHAEEFRTLSVGVRVGRTAAEGIGDAFEARFGMRPYEAYGCTELSPLVAVNVPPDRNSRPEQPSAREGTVGRPIPGVRAKVVHMETGAELPAGQEGMLLVTGPERDEGLFESARLDGQRDARRLVRDRRFGPDRRATDSSPSPGAKADFRKSAARWCRMGKSKTCSSRSWGATKIITRPW